MYTASITELVQMTYLHRHIRLHHPRHHIHPRQRCSPPHRLDDDGDDGDAAFSRQRQGAQSVLLYPYPLKSEHDGDDVYGHECEDSVDTKENANVCPWIAYCLSL